MRYKVFFDASCLLAALGSQRGGSYKLLMLIASTKHQVLTSEIATDEAKRHLKKIKSTNRKFSLLLKKFDIKVTDAPKLSLVEKYFKHTPDKQDAHLIASCFTHGCTHLVSLDKKHILSIAGRIKKLKVLSPGELINKII